MLTYIEKKNKKKERIFYPTQYFVQFLDSTLYLFGIISIIVRRDRFFLRLIDLFLVI